MTQTVIGIFDSAAEAQNAATNLISNGFLQDNIDISARNTSAGSSDNLNSSYSSHDSSSSSDSIGNFFSNLFGGHDDAKHYSEVARRGSIVTVHAQSNDEAQRAAQILDQYGAVDIDERANQYRGSYGSTATDATAYGSTTTDATAYDATAARSTTDDTTASIPIIEEQLNVGKREVETGRVRLRSRIVERPVEQTLRLREERVYVERNAVNRPATEADFAAFKEGTIEVTEHAEVPIASKEARVVEEVRLDKDVEERIETVRDTVRRTDVEIDQDRTNADLNRNRSLDQDDDASLNRPAGL